MGRGETNEGSLREALKSFIAQHKLEPGIKKVRVTELWHQLMGQGISSYTTAVDVKGDTLIVSLSSSVLRHELSLGKSKIIDLINESLGSEQIKQLILR